MLLVPWNGGSGAANGLVMVVPWSLWRDAGV